VGGEDRAVPGSDALPWDSEELSGSAYLKAMNRRLLESLVLIKEEKYS
jgi:hypothetical protein